MSEAPLLHGAARKSNYMRAHAAGDAIDGYLSYRSKVIGCVFAPIAAPTGTHHTARCRLLVINGVSECIGRQDPDEHTKEKMLCGFHRKGSLRFRESAVICNNMDSSFDWECAAVLSRH